MRGSRVPPISARIANTPAIVSVYGGPGVQTIRNAWSGATWDQVMAQRGFVVWEMDNRGSMGRGHAFETPLYRRLGPTELEDQKRVYVTLFRWALSIPRASASPAGATAAT